MDEKLWDLGKKAICCAGIIKDLMTILLSRDLSKLAAALESKECKNFIDAADAFAEKLK